MVPRVYITLISLSLNNPSHLRKPTIFYSLSLRLFSSSRPRKSDSAVALSDYLISQHHFSPEIALKASSSIHFVKNPKRSDLILSYLRESGFTQSHIEKLVIKAPRVLTTRLDVTIKPKIKIFQEFGFDSSEIADIVSSDPWILGRSANNQLGPSISALKSVLGSTSGLPTLLKRCGCFLKYNLEKTLLPNILFLTSCGVSSSQIVKYLFNFPRFFLHKPENVKDFVRRVDEMGIDRKSKKFLAATVVMSSMSVQSWELKLKLFQNLGLSEDDIMFVFRRVPQVFSISRRKIKDVIEVLLCKGKMDISSIVNHAELLICSVEGRLKPRLEVFEILERKNLLARKPRLTSLFKISDKMFLGKYVLPYSDELGDVQWLKGVKINE
ncbi:uncharacterized protein LOC110816800 [Carica papaya]|uniref:uncharacterized protein LOC110816800 n=1 Tax=Carica papaya TaxID=3649 RepID=UPI000B8CF9F6|nr:uncharacterized protein LOC110816800 [Carica papaya]